MNFPVFEHKIKVYRILRNNVVNKIFKSWQINDGVLLLNF